MQIFVTIRGIDKIQNDLRKFPKKAKLIYGDAVQKAGLAFQRHTKTLPPVSAKTTGYDARGMPVDTGHLRRNIKKRRIQQLAAGVFGGAKYSKFVHQGTSKMRKRPFFQWSLELGGFRKIDAIIKTASKLLP